MRKRVTVARAVPTRRGVSCAAVSTATSFGLISAAAKLWVKITTPLFFLDMSPETPQGLTSNKSLVAQWFHFS